MIDASFVNALFTQVKGLVEHEVRPQLVAFDPEKDYLDKDVCLPPVPPMAEPINIATLDGVVAFAMAQLEDKPMIIVDSATQVSVVGRITGRFRQREKFAVARFTPPQAPGFAFDKYIALETMVVALKAMFVTTPELAGLLKLLGNVQGSKVKTVQDDGVAQQVNARVGVASLAEVTLNPDIMLAGLRTFPEVAAPASRYVLRLKNGEGDAALPLVALFQADGGDWALKCINGIRDYLTAKLDGSEDAMGKDVPVIA